MMMPLDVNLKIGSEVQAMNSVPLKSIISRDKQLFTCPALQNTFAVTTFKMAACMTLVILR